MSEHARCKVIKLKAKPARRFATFLFPDFESAARMFRSAAAAAVDWSSSPHRPRTGQATCDSAGNGLNDNVL
jgi:hypothetical protein